MAYPPPPGLKASQSSSNSSALHPSLPARPPPSAHPPSSFKPAFTPSAGSRSASGYGNNDSKGPGSGAYGGFTAFKPRAVASSTPTWQSQPSISAHPAPPTAYSAPQTSYTGGGFQANPYQQQAYYPQANDTYAQPTPPQIRNPFPLPGQEQDSASRGVGAARGRFGDSTFDPEYEAQIAQWQSAYAGKDDFTSVKGAGRNKAEGSASAGGANAIPLGGRAAATNPISDVDMNAAVHMDTGVAAVVADADGKQKTVVRSGGGKTWQDSTLLDWDPTHFRLFIGNLAGEVTDESLLKAFSRYASVQKSHVVRDKRTTKSKGYGFVSFSSGDDFFQAGKEMQGKYIGSHPVTISRSTTEIRPTVPQDKRRNGKNGKGGNKAGGGANTGAGVQKKQSKTKGGLKVLG